MSSSISSGRVPAWKRLGLKLKQPASDEQVHTSVPASAPVPNKQQSVPSVDGAANAKRKSSAAPALGHPAKKPRGDDSRNSAMTKSSPQATKKSKSVSFAGESAQADVQINGIADSKDQPLTKNGAKILAKPAAHAIVNLEPSLAYLRQWHNSRDTWKFNKNHQTKLLEQVFADGTTIPAADINIFYDYISGLKGFVRTRLKALAAEVKSKDMEQGSAAFTSGKEMAEKKQKEYQDIIAVLLRTEKSSKKRRFDEVEFVLRTSDMEMQRRVVKRMRAEMILEDLSDEEDAMTTTSSGTSGTATTQDSSNAISSQSTTADADGDKRVKLNDGSSQSVKRKRKSKSRTQGLEDSSSESESESDSESSSTSSSSEESSDDDEDEDDEDDEMELVPEQNELETSSSSSSSEDDDDDGSEEDSAAAASGGDDEEDDDEDDDEDD